MENFRDVSGDGIELPDGSRMAVGVVYRAGKLAPLSDPESRLLTKVGLAKVIDLRTDAVARRSPDPAVRGAKRYLVNVFAVYQTEPVPLRSEASVRAHMRRMNVDFVADAAQRRQIATALELIASADGPVLVHCTEGKDRTGWISALLQLIAGASKKQVMSEYLKSNQYRSGIIKAGYDSALRSSGRSVALAKRALLRVEAEYLDAGLAELEKRYGDLSGYLDRGLGLSARTVASLRDRLTA